MKPLALSLCLAGAWGPVLVAASLPRQPLPPAAAEAWTHHLVPLPKEIQLEASLPLAPDQIRIVAPESDSPLVAQAMHELSRSVRQTQGSPPVRRPRFTIRLQLGGPEAIPLSALTNAAQAYRIIPEPRPAGLRLVALEPPGLLYAARTLGQLLRARREPTRVHVPVVTIRDWPDLEDRGLWGADAYECLEWLAERKLNYVEQIAAVSVDPPTRTAHAAPKPGHAPLLDIGPRLGIQFVPVVLHLEQLSGKGVFEAYPHLRAKGGKPGAICYAQPDFVRVLADWLVDLKRLPGVREVDVWMTENLAGQGGCRCDACQQIPYALAELRGILAAWRDAQKVCGPFGLRVLTSEETYPEHKRLFAELPPDVKLWYYHSLLTYTAREAPMIAGETLRLIQRGQWVGVCPSLVAYVGFTQPFTGAHFVHARATEFVRRGLRGVIGYAVPRTRYNRFNVEALAEWTWHAAGRTPRQFAHSWAVRNGLPNPATFAEWSETLGPVAWDVYGSDWPAGEQRRVPGPVATLLREGRLPPLGEVKWGVYPAPWGDFKSPEQLQAAVRSAARAVELARILANEEILQETLVVQGYVNALHALWELKARVTPDGVATEHRDQTRVLFDAYQRGLGQAAAALVAWERAIPGRPEPELFVDKPRRVIQTMLEQMAVTRRALGVDSAAPTGTK